MIDQYQPCPRCGAGNAQKLSFTWWGGLLGPKLLTHVKCGNCAHKFNGKTGKDNTTGIVIYSVVVGLVVFGIVFVFVVAAALLALAH
ncbi:MAG: hypothetical protein ABI539_06220 [Acidobacteriota bacterium]